MIRPIRESLATDLDKNTIATLFTATFIGMLVVIPAYSWIVSRWPRPVPA
ncbi:MAG: hypothetical protein AAF488_15750 [Planctomycetota bacterium]